MAVTSAEILRHICTFVSETLSEPELRHRLFSLLRSKTLSLSLLKPLNLASETLENATSSSSPSVRSSSLHLAEKLLISLPENPFKNLILALIYSLFDRPIESAKSILDIFIFDPYLARAEIAPQVFEEMFLMHFLPVLQWLNDRRAKVTQSSNFNSGYDESFGDESVVISSTRLLSKMSEEQASELKKLEREYERVLDENCRAFAGYFKLVLENKDESRVIEPPVVVLEGINDGGESGDFDGDRVAIENAGLRNGRYNPMWAEGEKSVELKSSATKNLTTLPSFFPERVSPKVLTSLRSTRKLKTPPNDDSDSEIEQYSEESDYSSVDPEAVIEEKNRKLASFNSEETESQNKKDSISIGTSRSHDLIMAEIDNLPGGSKNTPPKDFVCPITSTIFDDPVTLETGQTYERKAIQEWIDRGNNTCPITRQKLLGDQLPKTNYVLKRLIAIWLEQNPGSKSPLHSKYSQTEPEPVYTSPNSVITQATVDGTAGKLRPVITKLCMSEILKESETAVLQIERYWMEVNMDIEIQIMLLKPPVINGFVEILCNSVDPLVLTKTIYLLSELGSRDNAVIQTLTRVDSDVECIIALFKKGLLEAIVLIYLLSFSSSSMVEVDMIDSLLTVIRTREDDMVKMCMKPRTAAVLLLGRIFENVEEAKLPDITRRVISFKAIENIVSSLQAESFEEKLAAVGILFKCMQVEGKCRIGIAEKAELAPVLESFLGANDEERFAIVQFLNELVKLNRRTFNEQVLHSIKDEGTSSTMHTLLIYLQTALQDQCPIVASLLLQLDLLVEPRKMSIYREEAIDTLISCLANSEFPAAQIAAAETILALQGSFSSSGKSMTRALLLKRGGTDKRFKSLMKKELIHTSSAIQENMDEGKAAEEWERRMAYVLVSHEFGLIFEALSEGLKSRYTELSTACFLSSVWLVHMLDNLPDTGIKGAARVCLSKRLVSIFKSAKDTEDKILAMLALNSFIRDPDGLRDMGSNMKDILRGLRELRKSSTMAFEMLKVLSDGQDTSADLWTHKELVQEDCRSNGEVTSLACFRDTIVSGHSDGTLKVWTARGNGNRLHLIQEFREHTKAITSLATLQTGNKLYSGSLDRTVRVWSINSEVIQCTEVHDMKDQVNNLVVSNSLSCFISQGAGIKMHSWNGGSKLLNPSKYAKCLALLHGKLYCGCSDNSIQEIDLATGTISSILNGTKKFMSKSNPIQALEARDGLIYSASAPVDGAAVKIWSATNHNMVGSLPSTSEVKNMVISSDLIYLGCKGGYIEVWSKKKKIKIETLQFGSNSKPICMALDVDEEVLVLGTSDGKIQAWLLT